MENPDSNDVQRFVSDKEYGELRVKLIKFARMRGVDPSHTAEVVDEAIYRLIEKINNGMVLETNFSAAAYGFLKKVLSEHFRNQTKSREHVDETYDYDKALASIEESGASRKTGPAIDSEDVDEIRLECLDSCMKEICKTENDRQMVLGYYGAEETGETESGEKVQPAAGDKLKDKRKFLAREMNLTPEALRVRVLRLRNRLEECIAECVRQKLSPVTKI